MRHISFITWKRGSECDSSWLYKLFPHAVIIYNANGLASGSWLTWFIHEESTKSWQTYLDQQHVEILLYGNGENRWQCVRDPISTVAWFVFIFLLHLIRLSCLRGPISAVAIFVFAWLRYMFVCPWSVFRGRQICTTMFNFISFCVCVCSCR